MLVLYCLYCVASVVEFEYPIFFACGRVAVIYPDFIIKLVKNFDPKFIPAAILKFFAPLLYLVEVNPADMKV